MRVNTKLSEVRSEPSAKRVPAVPLRTRSITTEFVVCSGVIESFFPADSAAVQRGKNHAVQNALSQHARQESKRNEQDNGNFHRQQCRRNRTGSNAATPRLGRCLGRRLALRSTSTTSTHLLITGVITH